MTHEEAIARAVKLLRLARSDNPNEAASAAAKAQEIIDRYKLGSLSIDQPSGVPDAPDEPVRDLKAAPLETPTLTIPSWKFRLASAIARSNQCQIYYNRVVLKPSLRNGFALAIVGRPSDAETVRYLYDWLRREVDRLTERDGAGLGKTWRNNFRFGVIDTIRTKLEETSAQTQSDVRAEAFAHGGESAIVRVNTAIAKIQERAKGTEAFVKGMKLTSTGSRNGSYDQSARNAGQIAGREISIGGAKRGLGAGHKAIGGGS